jgi:hypothetical protein
MELTDEQEQAILLEDLERWAAVILENNPIYYKSFK